MWLLRRSISGLFLLRQVLSPLPVPEKKMTCRNDRLAASSGAPASPATPSGKSVIPYDSVSSCGSCSNISAGVKSGKPHNRNENWQMIRVGSFEIYYKISSVSSGIRLRQLVPMSASGPTDKGISNTAYIHLNKRKYQMDSISKLVNIEDAAASSSSENVTKFPHESPMSDCRSEMEKYCLPTEFGNKRKHFSAVRPHSEPRNMNYGYASKNSDCSKGFRYNEPFDICLPGGRSSELQASLYARNMENQNEEDHMVEFTNPEALNSTNLILRPGMVLLKHYVTHTEQVEIVKKCRQLGLGPGGFYQPGFKDGAKLRLQMMCLGRNWDPETRKYGSRRTIDRTQPPGIPHEFSLLVKRAIEEAHAHIKEELRVSSVEEILPSISPDICIANFYTTSGRLGLHQDRDESRKSLGEGLPVVSISIGDSADFLYGDQRDIGKAESVVLESGDVLIFGGHSRHIFHGVTSIIPDSAPMNLLEETKLRPGRLNLTFRQY
ncbi:hypothetical protein CerSpe_228170 [Prunus speciosa]